MKVIKVRLKSTKTRLQALLVMICPILILNLEF